MLQVKDLVKYYGQSKVLDGVSFSLEKGHIYGFIGPNGAGKSTTLAVIAGTLSYDGGDINICGHSLWDEPDKAKKEIGYLPETAPLYYDMTVFEYLEFIACAKGIPNELVSSQVNAVMEKTEVTKYQNRLISTLSKGMGQRVGIAGALIGSPKLLILDEPSSGLDPRQALRMKELILSLKDECTVIVSSHVLSEICDTCDRIIVINHGRIIANSSTEEFAASGSTETVIHLTVGTDEEAIRKIISRIDRTAEITVTPNTGRSGFSNAVIRFKGKKDPKEKIFNGFSAISIPITELYAETDSLENAYCKLIEEDEGSFVENPSDGSNDKGSFSLIKALFGQSVYKKDQDSSKNDQDSDDGDDSYRPLFH